MFARTFSWDRLRTIFPALAGATCLAVGVAATVSGEPVPTAVVTEAIDQAEVEDKAELELVGIGAALRSVDGYAEVHKVIPGSAADLDGRLKKGDRIIGIGQGPDGDIEDAFNRNLSDVAMLIRGKSGTVVRLEVRPVDNPKQTEVYAITRAQIDLNNEKPRSDGLEAEASALKALATPTHHQTAVIKANVENLPATKLKSFALTPQGQILAGCTGETGEIRVFDNEGNYIETWSLAVQPEAMYAREDGTVFIAGEGQLLKLDGKGNLVAQSAAPHVEVLKLNADDIRKEVLERHKQTTARMAQQGEMYDRVIEQTEKQIKQLREQIAGADDDEKDVSEDKVEVDAAKQAMLEKRIAVLENRIEQYKQVKARWEETLGASQPAELTEEQLEQQVQAAIQYKMAASSVSATEDTVFVATRAAVGYGFEVWRMNNAFEDGTKIINGLSGCCGQMDVKVNDQGVFVAENSKHRVCRYDRDGELIATWGHGDRTSLEGFGSCCNPMNVAFGPEEVVYTAEDNTGRIKRYSPDGKLLGLVGSVDLVPGCKNCSIAVGPGGDQVYMLDITRDHIVRMDRYAPGEAPEPMATAAEPTGTLQVQAAQPVNGGQIIVRGLTNLLRLRAAQPAAETPPAVENEEQTQSETNQ